MTHDDGENEDEADEEPDVYHLEVGRFGEAAANLCKGNMTWYVMLLREHGINKVQSNY